MIARWKLATVAALLQLSEVPVEAARSDEELELMWSRFQTEYGKSYLSEELKKVRFNAFRANVQTAMSLNSDHGINCRNLFDGKDCMFGITKFSDFLPDELDSTRLGHRRDLKRSIKEVKTLDLTSQTMRLGTTDELQVDWRSKGAVSQVRDQKDCGMCWAISTAEGIESALFMKTGKLTELSEQQIVSCDRTDSGCDGGDLMSGLKYVKSSSGLASAEDYPDTSAASNTNGTCTANVKPVVKLLDYKYAVPTCPNNPNGDEPCDNQDEDGLAKVLASKGPLSVCVTWGPGWYFYKSGVYSRTCSNAVGDIDHCMQLVGYNKSGDTPYWILKNSMGTSWGMDGYIQLEMGKNLCGVANEAAVLEVEPLSDTDLVV
eukprot:TRINITY_DN33605_c1_g1_i1.p1 TRINITY_DN33605_c1_g1~~TRINITY_DN33605_c1_g1_i1.p1  ORF type:complete len:375 (-),score=63.39 TRINITY_DN33605_c1_g1_i1:422-1546(-)